MTPGASYICSYTRTDGAFVSMSYVSEGRSHKLVMQVNDITWRIADLARPYKPSARHVAKRWRSEDKLAPAEGN